MLEVRTLSLPEIKEIVPPRFGDHRGFFSETWNRDVWRAAGIDLDFVQDNFSFSASKGVLRGLHFQTPPMAQDKLVRVGRGAVFDVAVDIRRGSPTYGQWVSTTLTAAIGNQLLVPKGFAHGFITLEPDTEVQYKVTAPYSREHDGGFRFDDPTIGVEWPVPIADAILSDKDTEAPLLAKIDPGFYY